VKLKLTVKKFILAVIVSGMWMNLSEYVCNELVLKDIWLKGYHVLGLVYPSSPINTVVWVVWIFVFAVILTWSLVNNGIVKSTLVCWTAGFALFWLAMWNMGILPSDVLWTAVPWSLIEVYIAALVSKLILHQ